MKKLLFLVLALASSLTLAAQTTLTGRVVATPNTEWTPAYVYYDLSEVATTLSYADAANVRLLARARTKKSNFFICSIYYLRLDLP